MYSCSSNDLEDRYAHLLRENWHTMRAIQCGPFQGVEMRGRQDLFSMETPFNGFKQGKPVVDGSGQMQQKEKKKMLIFKC